MATTDKSYISRQCTYCILFILKRGVFTKFLANNRHLAWLSIWVSTTSSLFNKCILCFALHNTQGAKKQILSKCYDCSIKNFNCYLKFLYLHLTSITPIITKGLFGFFLYSGLFDWLPLLVFHCCILLYCYIFCFISTCENFREMM